MKKAAVYFCLMMNVAAIMIACDGNDPNPSLANEVWPKEGYLFTKNDDLDTVYVETSGHAVTSPYMAKYPLDDPSKKWKISLPSSGEGVFIYNDKNQYWSIDSAFHPGAMVEQYFITVKTVSDKSKLGAANRFKYHKAGDKTFYIESVKFPKYFVAALGHAESGRGLRLIRQDEGTWEFWVENY